jgi:hypothetical protein
VIVSSGIPNEVFDSFLNSPFYHTLQISFPPLCRGWACPARRYLQANSPRLLRRRQFDHPYRAFLAKPPLEEMLRRMPVKVILNREAGLLGAAVFAAGV